MTERRSKLVRALGNGGYTWVAIIRGVGIFGFLAIAGAIFWAGSTASSVTTTLERFIQTQTLRDERQDERMTRQGARIERMMERLINEGRPR